MTDPLPPSGFGWERRIFVPGPALDISCVLADIREALEDGHAVAVAIERDDAGP